MLLVFCGSIASGKSSSASEFLIQHPNFYYTSIDKVRDVIYTHEQNLTKNTFIFKKWYYFAKERYLEWRCRHYLKKEIVKNKDTLFECLGCRDYNKKIVNEYVKAYPLEKVIVVQFVAEIDDLKNRIKKRVEKRISPYPQSWRFLNNKFLSDEESLLVGISMCNQEPLVFEPNLIINTSKLNHSEVQLEIKRLFT